MVSKIREGGLKMRLAFRASIYLLALVIYLVFVAISYNDVSSDELERATHSMQSETCSRA